MHLPLRRSHGRQLKILPRVIAVSTELEMCEIVASSSPSHDKSKRFGPLSLR